MLGLKYGFYVCDSTFYMSLTTTAARAALHHYHHPSACSAEEKRPEVKLCLAEPADAPLVASGHKMERSLCGFDPKPN